MTKKEFKNLKMGDIIRYKQNPIEFVVIKNLEDHIITVSSTSMTIPEQWEKIEK